MSEILDKIKSCQTLADIEALYPARQGATEANIVRMAPL